VDAFAAALALADVSLRLSSRVSSIRADGNGLAVVHTGEGHEKREPFDRVIVAAGGKAYPSLGSHGELFPALADLGHTVIPKRPALAPLLADLRGLKPLLGVKLDIGAELWDGTDRLASTAGNVIFTEWGLNGPAVMDLSHHVSARPDRRLTLSLNFLRFFEKEFDDFLKQKRASKLPIRIFFEAFFPPKAASLFPSLRTIEGNLPLDRIDEPTLQGLITELHDERLPVKGVRGFEYCQLSAGGVPVTETDPQTLESRKVKGLYLTGETLDVVGPCGGYNLQFAFASGALAGIAAAETSSIGNKL
jgi:predicted Rossmann fold flavoprotein